MRRTGRGKLRSSTTLAANCTLAVGSRASRVRYTVLHVLSWVHLCPAARRNRCCRSTAGSRSLGGPPLHGSTQQLGQQPPQFLDQDTRTALRVTVSRTGSVGGTQRPGLGLAWKRWPTGYVIPPPCWGLVKVKGTDEQLTGNCQSTSALRLRVNTGKVV